MCCVFAEHATRGDTLAAPAAAVATGAVGFEGVVNNVAASFVGTGASALAAVESGWPFDVVEALPLFLIRR